MFSQFGSGAPRWFHPASRPRWAIEHPPLLAPCDGTALRTSCCWPDLLTLLGAHTDSGSGSLSTASGLRFQDTFTKFGPALQHELPGQVWALVGLALLRLHQGLSRCSLTRPVTSSGSPGSPLDECQKSLGSRWLELHLKQYLDTGCNIDLMKRPPWPQGCWRRCCGETECGPGGGPCKWPGPKSKFW